MDKDNYIIQINEEGKPFNVYMALPVSVFKRVYRLLKEEILKGLADSDLEDRVILHLSVDDLKIKKLKKLISTLERKGNPKAGKNSKVS